MNLENKHILDSVVWFYLDSNKEIFNRIYEKNLWKSSESVSGKGSDKTSVKNIIQKLPELFNKLDIKTILDAPCGDFIWMREIDYEFNYYLGVDIVQILIDENNKKYAKENREFKCLDIINSDFSKFDLILVRDCFIHLTYEQIFKTLSNFKNSKSKYLLLTTHKNVLNKEIYQGGFRKLDFEKAPFNFPKPKVEILEDEKEQKYLALWSLDEL